MSDHDFEKQVRRQMEGFKVRPSEGSWDALEKTLNRQPRRRRGLIWIPLTLVLLTAGVISLIYLSDSGSSEMVVRKQESLAGERSAAKENSTQNNTLTDRSSGPVQAVPSTGHGLTPMDTPEDINTSKGVIDEIPTKQKTIIAAQEHFRATELVQNNLNSIANTTKVQRLAADRSSRFPQAGIENDKLVNSHSEQVLRHAVVNQQPAASQHADISKLLDAPFRPLPTDVLSAKKHQPSLADNRWSWGLTLGSGVSGISTGELFGLKRAEVADFAQAPNSAMLPWLGITYQPADITPGLAYTAGAFIRRESGKRIALSAGLQYTRLSSTIQLGSRVDSGRVANSGNNGFLQLEYFYRPEKEKKYSMNYHYLDLPLALHYKANQNSVLPVEISAGAVFSKLLSTSALHFDGSSGIYYENDALVNPWQVAVQGSVTTDLFRRSKLPVKIGPVFRYTLNNLLTSDLPEKNRFMSIGLEAKIFLNKVR